MGGWSGARADHAFVSIAPKGALFTRFQSTPCIDYSINKESELLSMGKTKTTNGLKERDGTNCIMRYNARWGKC